jgi:hypothetical protein
MGELPHPQTFRYYTGEGEFDSPLPFGTWGQGGSRERQGLYFFIYDEGTLSATPW